MTTSELSEFLLSSLFDAAEEQGYHQIFYLREFAEKVGVKDEAKISNAARILYDRGLIQNYNETIGGGPKAKISGEGCLFVERGGETGVIPEFKRHPEKFLLIDKSTKIYGPVSNSNIAVNVSNTIQSISSGNYLDLISKMAEVIKNDTSLSDLEIEDVLKDIEALKLQCGKTSMNRTVVSGLLEHLSNVSSIGSLILQIKSILFPVS